MSNARVLSTAVHCFLLSLLFSLLPRTTQAQDVTLTPSGKVLSGADEYRQYCAQCHGISGRGDGSVASELKVPPPDLTLLSRNNRGQFPFQMVYESISGKNQLKAHGTREMPSFYLQFARPRNQYGMGTLRRSDYQIDQEIKRITNYIKSIQQQ
jgi:mono/diheme cytochrome c family protein